MEILRRLRRSFSTSSFSDVLESIRARQKQLHQQRLGQVNNTKGDGSNDNIKRSTASFAPNINKIKNKKLLRDLLASVSEDNSYENDPSKNGVNSDTNEAEDDALMDSLVLGLKSPDVSQGERYDNALYDQEEATVMKVKDAVGPASEGELRYMELQKKLKYKRDVRSKLIPEIEKKVRYRRERPVDKEKHGSVGATKKHDVNNDDEDDFSLISKSGISMTDAGFAISYNDHVANKRIVSPDEKEYISIEEMKRLVAAKIETSKSQAKPNKLDSISNLETDVDGSSDNGQSTIIDLYAHAELKIQDYFKHLNERDLLYFESSLSPKVEMRNGSLSYSGRESVMDMITKTISEFPNIKWCLVKNQNETSTVLPSDLPFAIAKLALVESKYESSSMPRLSTYVLYVDPSDLLIVQIDVLHN